MTYQVMKDISEVRKAMDITQEMFDPLHDMIVVLKQHGVDVTGVQVAEKNVQVTSAAFDATVAPTPSPASNFVEKVNIKDCRTLHRIRGR